MLKYFCENVELNFHLIKNQLNETNLIYLLKFPNGKYYVGQTTSKDGLKRRIYHHCHEAYKNEILTYKDKIIRRYKKIDIFILHKCDTSYDVDFYEIFYINILKRKLINFESGGKKNKTINNSTRKLISENLKKYYSNKERKKRVIEVYDSTGKKIKEFNSSHEASTELNISKRILWEACEKHYLLNKKYQLKYKESNYKIKDYTRILTRNGTFRKEMYYIRINGVKKKFTHVHKYDSNGNYIESIDVLTIPKDKIDRIRYALHHKSFVYDSLWSLDKLEKIEVPLKQYEKISKKFSYPVYQLNDSLEIIKEWKNTKEASIFFEVNQELIRQVCVGMRAHCKKFVWCYAKDYDNFDKIWYLNKKKAKSI